MTMSMLGAMGMVVTLACNPWEGNGISVASCRLEPAAEGMPSSRDACARLADLTGEAWVGWQPADEVPMTLELRWDGVTALDVVVCHWRRMPASYEVDVGDADGWRRVARVEGNTILNDKIALHQFATLRADRLRLTITSPVDREAGVLLRGLEAYSKAAPPAPVAEFLGRKTPGFMQSRKTLAQWRLQHGDDPLDESLLSEEPRRWKPIPSRLYGMKETGRIVNETAAAHDTCLSRLCHRYAETGRSEYARQAWQFLAATIAHYDRHQAFRFVGRQWQAVTFQEPAYKLAAVPCQYEQIAEALDDEQRLRVLYFIQDVADFQYRAILEFTPLPENVDSVSDFYNWVPNSLGALTLTAAWLREFPQAGIWVEACDARFPGFFKEIFFLSDGTWWECSPAHHVYVLRGMYRYALAKQLLGDPVWDRTYSGVSLTQAFEALAKTATPLREYPSLNDSSGSQRPMDTALVEAATIMGRGDMLHAWRARPRWPDIPALKRRPVDVVPPAYCSTNMPAAGMAVLRDGWDRDDAYLVLDYGPHGGGHGQLDKLTFILFQDGHQWVPDAADAPHYSIFPEQRTWHRQTVAHNTVLVDQKSQKPATGRLLCFEADEAIGFVCANSGEAYDHVLHTRSVLHPRDDYYLFHDVVEASDNGEHRLEWLLHVYGAAAGQRPGRLLFRRGKRGLAVFSCLIGESPVKIERGLCGGLERATWTGMGYPGKGDPGWLYIPYLRLPMRLESGNRRADFLVVLSAYEGDVPPPIELCAIPASPGTGSGLRIVNGDTEDTYESPETIPGQAKFTRRRLGKTVSHRVFKLEPRPNSDTGRIP